MDGFDIQPRFSDWAFWVYNTLIIILLLLFGGGLLHRWPLLFSNVVLILFSLALVLLARKYPAFRELRFLRNWYPFLYFFYLHWESGLLNKIFFKHTFDGVVKLWDITVFGDYLHQIVNQFRPMWFAEYVHFAYFFYYILLLLPGVLLYWNNRERYTQYILDVTLLYLIQYFVYFAFPVYGPVAQHSVLFPHGVLFIPIMKFLYKIGDNSGGAFPSSHVSIATVAWYWVWTCRPKIAYSVLIFAISLIFSTVYLSYHYAIDALAGFILGVLYIYLMKQLRSRFETVQFT